MFVRLLHIELRLLFVLLYIFLQVLGRSSEMLTVHLDNAQYGALLEVYGEGVSLFLIAQVVAPWKECLNSKLLFIETLLPEVFTETSLCGKLSIVREVIVPLIWLQMVMRALLISDVKPDVIVYGIRPRHGNMAEFKPAQLLQSSLVIRLNRLRMRDYKVLLHFLAHRLRLLLHRLTLNCRLLLLNYDF